MKKFLSILLLAFLCSSGLFAAHLSGMFLVTGGMGAAKQKNIYGNNSKLLFSGSFGVELRGAVYFGKDYRKKTPIVKRDKYSRNFETFSFERYNKKIGKFEDKVRYNFGLHLSVGLGIDAYYRLIRIGSLDKSPLAVSIGFGLSNKITLMNKNEIYVNVILKYLLDIQLQMDLGLDFEFMYLFCNRNIPLGVQAGISTDFIGFKIFAGFVLKFYG